MPAPSRKEIVASIRIRPKPSVPPVATTNRTMPAKITIGAASSSAKSRPVGIAMPAAISIFSKRTAGPTMNPGKFSGSVVAWRRSICMAWAAPDATADQVEPLVDRLRLHPPPDEHRGDPLDQEDDCGE